MSPLPQGSSASHLRNFVFGVEDSLVSTVGLLSGVAIAGMESKAILVTGVVLIFVEAFSMAVGSFLSEHTAQGYLTREEAPFGHSLVNGGIMFVSYFFSGFIPLFPYFIWVPIEAFSYSIAFSLLALFVLGAIGAKLSELNPIKAGIRMFIVGGIAIGVGILVGRAVGGSMI